MPARGSGKHTGILFCWELGANFGHLTAIASIQPQLEAAGFDLAFAVRDLSAAAEMLPAGSKVLQAPVWPPHLHRGSGVGAASFSDVLALIGYAETAKLRVMVDAWLRLFELTGATIIVSDHSPAAQLAARVSHRRLVCIGTGFTMPPLGAATFPLLRGDVAPAMPERLLQLSAEAVAKEHGLNPLQADLPCYFESDQRVVIGLPELDPYASFRREPLMAPPGGFPTPKGPKEKSVFVYLGSEMPGLESKVQVLCDLPCPVEFHIRGADPFLIEFIRLRDKIAHPRPADMHQILARCSHVVSQGGAMMTSLSLAAGRPHLMLPQHAETRLNSVIVTRLGAGRISETHGDSSTFEADVKGFVEDRQTQARAENIANVLATRPLLDGGAELICGLVKLAHA